MSRPIDVSPATTGELTMGSILEHEPNEIEVRMDNGGTGQVEYAKSNDASLIKSPTFKTVDTAILEGNETTDEDIETLNANVERHISMISRWIHAAHAMAKNESYWWRGFSGPASTIRDKLMPKSLSSAVRNTSEQMQSKLGEVRKDEKKTPDSPVSDKFFPPMVEIAPKVEESFQALDKCLMTASKIKTKDGMDGSNQVQSIVGRVAQVPSLLKTILLIHKQDDRKRILSCKIVKRVMICPFSVMHEDELREYTTPTREVKDNSKDDQPTIENMTRNIVPDISDVFSSTTHKKKNWLVRMLENGYGPIKKVAVGYLELLSDLTVVDYILDEGANPTPNHIDMFLQSREEIFSAVENLHHLIPAMISLEGGEQERAATTLIIRRVLDNAIVRPFGITILFCDLVFHIFIVFGWRNVVFRLVAVADSDDSDTNHDDHFSWFLESMTAISTVYFSWRLVGEIFSSLITSWRVFKANFRTFWTLVDVASIVMAFICFQVLLADGDVVYSPARFRFFAILTGFLWLKLLSFLKVMNPSLATFVLAIVQIIKDVKWIVLILVMVILAFGDMFFIIMKTDSEVCPADPSADDNPYCDQGLSYLDAFVQILGQFDYTNYLGNPITIVLFIIMTVFGAIIFLNILIAVVSDSYSKATAKSARLFGRARILTVAKINALEYIMEPKWLNRQDRPLIKVLKVLFKLLTYACFMYGIYWLVKFTLRINDGSGSTTGAVVSTLIMFFFFFGAIISFTLFITGWGEARKFPKLRILNDNVLITWIYWKPMVFITKLMLGLTFKRQASERYDEHSDEWSERMIQFDSMINNSVERSESRLVGIITSLETRLKEYEMQRAMEFEALKETLTSHGRDNF